MQWQTGAGNLARTTNVLKTIAQKYGTTELADTVVAIELINEPTNTLPNTLKITKSWTESTYEAVRCAASNKNLHIVMHDQWVTPKNWLDTNRALNGPNPGSFILDLHQYQIFTEEDRSLNQPGHIGKVCKFAMEQLSLAKSNGLPVHVGEFSGNTFICVNRGGSSFADPEGTGKLCHDDESCQCEADGGITVDEWSDALTQNVRWYIETQLYAYEQYAGGWFFWNFKGPGSWGFMTGVEKVSGLTMHMMPTDTDSIQGFIPQPLTSRRYRNPCA